MSGRFPEEEMATHPSVLAWEIPWTEESGRPQPLGLQSQRRASTRTHTHTHTQTHKTRVCIDGRIKSVDPRLMASAFPVGAKTGSVSNPRGHSEFMRRNYCE